MNRYALHIKTSAEKVQQKKHSVLRDRFCFAFVQIIPPQARHSCLHSSISCTSWSPSNSLRLRFLASSQRVICTTDSHQPRGNPTACAPSKDAASIQVFGRSVPISGHLLLLFVPLLWGSYAVCIKLLSHLSWSLDPVVFNMFRLMTSALFVLPTLYDFLIKRRQTLSSPVLAAGFELGFWTLVTNLLQISGLKYVNASRSAFLTQLCTVMVPFMSFFSGLESSIPKRIWAACFISVFGVGFLSLDGTSTSSSIYGDAFLLGSAFASAIYVIRSKQHSDLGNASTLTAAKVFGQFIFSLIHLFVMFVRSNHLTELSAVTRRLFIGSSTWLILLHVVLALYTGILLCWGSTALQLRGQKMVSASEAAVIFSTTPLWATALAIPLGERFGSRGIIGACLITFATLMTTAGDHSTER